MLLKMIPLVLIFIKNLKNISLKLLYTVNLCLLAGKYETNWFSKETYSKGKSGYIEKS